MKILITLILLVVSEYSLACSCDELTDQQLIDNSQAVYLAKVTETKLIKNNDSIENDSMQSATFGPESIEMIEAKFEIIEKFKEQKSEVKIVHDLPFAPGNCSIGLMSGQYYLFYISTESKNINYVGMCTGSQMVNMQYRGLEAQLKKVRETAKNLVINNG